MTNRQIALIAAAIMNIQRHTSIIPSKNVINDAKELLKFLEHKEDK